MQATCINQAAAPVESSSGGLDFIAGQSFTALVALQADWHYGILDAGVGRSYTVPCCYDDKAGIPRRRHRHRHGHPRRLLREEIACVGRKDCSRVWRVGVGVGAVECQLN